MSRALALLAILASTSAWAQKKLAVVELSTPPSMMGLGNQVSAEVVAAAGRQRFKLVLPGEIRAQLGEKANTELKACLGAPTCLASRLAPFGAKQAVVGSLDRDEKNYRLKLWLVDLEQRAVVAEVDRAILIASRRFNRELAEAVPRLLRGEQEARGTLKLSSEVRGVNAVVDGVEVGTLPLTLQLKPGKHEVKLARKSYLPVERLVTVEAGKATHEQLRLLLAPGQTDEELRPLLAAKQPEAPLAHSGLSLSTPAWVALGLGALSAGVGGGFGYLARQAQTELEEGFDPTLDLYSGTRARALEGRRNATLANVFFAVAGASLLAGAGLTLWTGEEGAQELQATPVASGSGGGLQLQGSF